MWTRNSINKNILPDIFTCTLGMPIPIWHSGENTWETTPLQGPSPHNCTMHFRRVKNGKNDSRNWALSFLELIHYPYWETKMEKHNLLKLFEFCQDIYFLSPPDILSFWPFMKNILHNWTCNSILVVTCYILILKWLWS